MISTTAQYALRALTRLADEPKGAAVLGRTLAVDADIPANYLSKLLLTLRNAGIVDASRGTGGGYRLLRPATEIRLVEVVEIFDAPRARPTCLLGQSECSDATACAAHDAWKHVRNQYLAFLESTSLADISKTGAKIATDADLPPEATSMEDTES